jgi:hypothetical protein
MSEMTVMKQTTMKGTKAILPPHERSSAPSHPKARPLPQALLEALHGDHDDLSASNTYARVIRADEAPEFSYFANPPISPTESIIEVGILNKGGELTTSYYSAYTGARILALNLKTPDADTEDHDNTYVPPSTFEPIFQKVSARKRIKGRRRSPSKAPLT